jgi:hypothetical protein
MLINQQIMWKQLNKYKYPQIHITNNSRLLKI